VSFSDVREITAVAANVVMQMPAAVLIQLQSLFALIRTCQESAQFAAVSATAGQFTSPPEIRWLLRNHISAGLQRLPAGGQPV
jgi:hypothetical protein